MNKDRPAGWITGILDSQRPAIRCPYRVLDHVSSLGAVLARLWRTGDIREATSSQATELHQRPRARRLWLHRAEPPVDRGDVDGGFVADGEPVIAGGDGAVAFEPVDAAFGGVAPRERFLNRPWNANPLAAVLF